MSQNNTNKSSYTSDDELPTRCTTNTQTFLETCVLDADHKAMEEHLMSNPVQQSDLDRCLLRGLQLVQRNVRELSRVAPALTLLLQSGAKWNSDDLLDGQTTPYHIICESPGDHHELLDLMIKSSQKITIDKQDSYSINAVTYAVRYSNIKCLKCLLANGTDVNIGDGNIGTCTVVVAMLMLCSTCEYTSVYEDIFDLLLDKSSIEYYMYTSLVIVATSFKSFYCIKKLIEKGTRLDIIDYMEQDVWSTIAYLGNKELLKCMFNHGINKHSKTQNNLCVLSWVIKSGNVESLRYLLDLGFVIPTTRNDVRETQCEQCKEKTLIVDDGQWNSQMNQDPGMTAICYNKLEIVKLLDERGILSCKLFNVLRRAVLHDSIDVASYLLSNYTYPLNIEYTKESEQNKSVYTLLTELGGVRNVQITQLLLDHGADPAKQMCSAKSPNAMMIALGGGNLEMVAQYIRSGVNVNIRSCGTSLPFETSVVIGCHKVAKILLISGCSCGLFSLAKNHMFINGLKPKVKKLMKEWGVQDNNVTPLKKRCRSVILNHLSPRADVKIQDIPLPAQLIRFLGVSEIDDMVDEYKQANRD